MDLLKVGDKYTFGGVGLEVVPVVEDFSCEGCYFRQPNRTVGCVEQRCCDPDFDYFVIIKEVDKKD